MKNGKTIRTIFCLIFAALSIMLLYSACDAYVGLGAGIDILPPKGEITYPPAGETPIRGNFVIKGTANDDENIKSVSVSFKNVDTGWQSKAYSASLTMIQAGSFSWVAQIDNEATGTRTDHPLVKEYPIPDGTYTAVVTLTDNNDKKTKLNREYTIDNTPPVFIVSRPSTIVRREQNPTVTDPYGAVFTVVGEAEDKNKIEDLTLKVANSAMKISKKFVGKNINEQMAEAVKDSHDNYTDALYLYNHDNSNQKIKAHLFLTDNARFFKDDGNEGEGNTSEWYYLRDRDIRSVLEKGYTADVINDYFAGKTGSALSLKKSEKLLAALYDKNNAEGQDVKRILENSLISTAAGSEDYSIFTLDPDKSPGFKISGATNLPMEFPADTPDQNLPQPSTSVFQDGTPPTVMIELIGNKDNKPLVTDYTDYTSYRASGITINLYKCNQVFYTVAGSVKRLHLLPEITPAHSFKFADLEASDLTPQGSNPAVVALSGSNKLTVSWKLPDDFGSGGYYLIRVEGKDTDGNDFVAYNNSNSAGNNNSAGGVFVVHFKLIGDAPFITSESPSGYINTNFTIQANVYNLPLPRTVRYKIVKASPPDQNGAGASDPLLNLKTGSTTEYETTVPITSLSDEGRYVVHFWAKNDANKEAREKKEFVKDTKAPVPEMTFPPENEAQMGTVRIMGTISDNGAGVKVDGTKYIIGVTTQPELNSPDWKPMDKSTLVSWEFMYNLDDFSSSPLSHGVHISGSEYKIPVYILTEDKIGNKGITKKEIKFDKDGSKPIMSIQSPQQNQVLGGAIQIFGTGTVRTGVVGEVYIQFSKNGNFDSQADGTFGTSDWYNSGNGLAIPNTASGGASWQITVNENGEFNNPSTDPNRQNWDVYFRVRAKNGTTGTLGLWTTPVKINIDKAYPTVGSPEPLKIVNTDDTAPENYIQDMWIKEGKKLTGSLYDEAGIKDISISSPELFGSVPYNLQRALTEGLIVEDTAHAPNPPTGAKNYKLQIPLTIKESMKRKGNLSIKIKIVENTPNSLASETTLRMRFDVTTPVVAGGDWIVKSAHTSFSGGKFTLSSALNAAKITRYRVLVDDTAYEIDSVTDTRVTLKNASDLNGNFNYGIVERPVMVYNDGSDYQIKGIAADTVTGVQKVTAILEVAGTQTSVEMTRDDTNNKITQERGDMVSFQGSLNTNTVKNGIGTLTITAKDERENTVSENITNVIVKNKPVEITKLVFRTDLSGNGSYEADEEHKSENLGNLSADRNFSGTAAVASSFTFKNPTKSELSVTFKGGYGTNARISLHKEGSTSGTIGDEIAFTTGTIPAPDANTVVTLNLNGKLNIGDAPAKNLYLKVTDESVNTPWHAQVNVTVGLDVDDDVRPTGFIMPFFYNSDDSRITKPADVPLVSVVYDVDKDTQGVIKKVKEPLGHVELSPISGLGNNYPSVSGKVKLRGIAYDDVRLGEITLSGAGINETATFTAGNWSNGNLKIVKNKLSNTGHYVEWEYEWNTGTPDLDQSLTLTVKDAKTPSPNLFPDPSDPGHLQISEPANKQGLRPSGHALTLASGDAEVVKHQFIRLYQGDKSYLVQVEEVSLIQEGTEFRKRVTWDDTNNVPTDITNYHLYTKDSHNVKFGVNIVPYITEIVTGLKGADGRHKGSFSRASTGEYPVRAGNNTTETLAEKEKRKIHIKGFNLKHNSTYGNAFLGSTDLGNALESIYLDSSTCTSGELKVTVNSVDSINNKVDITKPYNLEDNGINNDKLNARRKLFVWKMKPIINNNFMESPQFVMDSKSNYYMSYGSLAGSNMSFNMMKNGTVNHTASQMASENVIEQCYSKYHNTVIAFDDNENMYGGATNTDRAGRSTSFTFFSREQGSSATGTSGNYDGGSNRRRLENSNNPNRGVYDVNRVQIPKLAVRGPGSDAKVALIYYDRNNDALPIKFRYGSVTAPDGISNGLGHNVNGNGGSSDPSGSGSAKGYEVIADNADTTVYKSGGYAAVALTSTERAVAVWYDSVNSRLVYSYRDVTGYTEPAAGAADRKTADWQGNAVVIDNGAPLYVDVAIDDEDGLHIGYYSSGDGGVKYAYLPPNKVKGTTKPASTDFKVVKVDTYMNPGTLLKIGVRKESGKQVPYISYYHNGFYGSANAARIAWLKDGIGSDGAVKNGVVNNKFTGDWVVMTVPASNGIQQYTICQGAPVSGNYQDKVVAAYFTTKNYEMAVLSK